MDDGTQVSAVTAGSGVACLSDRYFLRRQRSKWRKTGGEVEQGGGGEEKERGEPEGRERDKEEEKEETGESEGEGEKEIRGRKEGNDGK